SLRRERCLRQELGGVRAAAPTAAPALSGALAGTATARASAAARRARSDGELVDAPRLLVEEQCGPVEAKRTIQVAILRVGRLESIQVDADVLEQLPCRQVVMERRLDVQRAPVQREHAAVVRKLVALRVAAEVVVVVEDENPGVPADVLDEVMRRRQA